tara:strand:- start:808 stop:1050 length:243 start_codon:yes stop_codon:yes gene_type:complete
VYDLPPITEKEEFSVNDTVVFRLKAESVLFGTVLELAEDRKGKSILKVDWQNLDQITQMLNNDSRMSWVYEHQIEKVMAA